MYASNIKVYTSGTPNGKRPIIILEVLKLKYSLHRIDIKNGEQFTKEFKSLTPYSKIPVLTDINPTTGGIISIFETGAILQFIADKYDTEFKIHYPHGHPLYWEQQKWYFFTTSSLSPQQGNLSFYLNFAQERSEPAIKKSRTETYRIYDVLEQRLIENNDWFIGDHLNIVDISAYSFVRRYEFVKIDIENNYPTVWRWLQKLNKIEAFDKGYNF